MSRGKLYRESGVDIDKGDALAAWLGRQNIDGEAGGSLGAAVSGIGGFAGLFRPNFAGMEDPVLISGTDGVGTKVLLGIEQDRLEGLGIDLVAMCVNDLYTVGGRPLFFLDYYATGVLEESQFKRVLTGVRSGLELCSTVLLGGETAELPGLYKKGHFDLAGFVVGVVDYQKRVDNSRACPGDKLIAFKSSGFHSNGFSLVRGLLERVGEVDQGMMDRIMAPTKIYNKVPDWLSALGEQNCSAIANITGGGISGNLPRVLPHGVKAVLEKDTLPKHGWMLEFIDKAGISFEDVEPVFNMGSGMIACVKADLIDRALELAASLGLEPKAIGWLEEYSGDPVVEYQ